MDRAKEHAPRNDCSTDGVRMAILSSRMESIARKMQNTLFRTARSGVLNTAHDFSCVVLTADCRLLAARSEEHTSELQSQSNLVCRLLLEKKKNTKTTK